MEKEASDALEMAEKNTQKSKKKAKAKKRRVNRFLLK